MNVLVCGGGWVGVNAASRLARSGCRVTLLEKRDCLLSETSSRSTECFRLAWADATMRSFVGDSIELLEQDARKHGVSLSKPGYLFVSTDERKQLELAASFGRVREHRGNLSAYPKDAFEGVDVLFGSELINEAFPGRIANARQMVGVHMRRGGWLDTATLASRLANDFECKTNSEVEEILWSGSRARGVKLRSGQILEADAVVLSMGPSFSGFVKRAGFLQDVPMVNEIHAHCLFDNCSLPQAIPLTFFGESPGALPWTHAQKRAIENLSSKEAREVLLSPNLPPGLHFRKLANNIADSIWTWDRALDQEPPSFVPRVPSWYAAASIGTLAAYLPHHFLEACQSVRFSDEEIIVPSLRKIISGNYSMSPENRPLIDEIAPDSNVFVLGLFSGFGIMCASGASQLLTSIMLKKPLPSYAKAFSVGRYKDAEYLKNMHKIVSGKL